MYKLFKCLGLASHNKFMHMQLVLNLHYSYGKKFGKSQIFSPYLPSSPQLLTILGIKRKCLFLLPGNHLYQVDSSTTTPWTDLFPTAGFLVSFIVAPALA